jgi:hypothetical protein
MPWLEYSRLETRELASIAVQRVPKKMGYFSNMLAHGAEPRPV